MLKSTYNQGDITSEKSKYGNEEIDFELLACGLSEKQKLDTEYAKICVNLDELFKLPIREDFQQAGEAYFQEAISNTSSVYNTKDESRTLEADRIAYAEKMANCSKTKNSSVNVQKETLYMYLSHYVDTILFLSGNKDTFRSGIDFAKYRTYQLWTYC